MRKIVVLIVFFAACLTHLVGQDRIELGYQTTKRGIVWYRPGLPTHAPEWKFSRDTNAVLWVDTLTALRYDWDYLRNVWRTKGTATGAVPPLPVAVSGSATIDNRSAYWIRDTFSLIHKYDSTANAWTPWGDWFYMSDPPGEITATGTHGAAKYRRSLWQDADNNQVYFWNGSAWTPFASGSGDNWGVQVVQTTARLTGNGTSGSPLDIAQQGATPGQPLTWNGTTWMPQTPADNSATNEIQTLSAGGAGPSYTVDLSLSGGTVTLTPGSGISLSRSGNTITVTSTVSPGGNGIYGGSGTLPVGGSDVTIPGPNSGLDFLIDASAGNSFEGIRVITDYCNDDAYTYYFTAKSPLDSFKIENFDCSTILAEIGGYLTVSSDRELILVGDSIQVSTLPAKTVLPNILGTSVSGWISKISGSSNGQILKWNSTTSNWELGSDNTGGSGTVTGTGTANRVAYWTSSTNIAADDDLQFDATNVGVGTGTMTGKFNVNAGSAFTPLPINAYATSQSGGIVYAQISDTRTAGQTFLSLNEQADVNTVRAGLRRYGSTHATLPNQLDLVTIGSAPVTISTNATVRMTVAADGTVHATNKFAAGFSSATGIHSTLQSAGSLAAAYLETVGAPTFDDTKRTVVYTGTTNVTWTLPTASTCTGREYILHHSNTAGTITLSQTITKGNTGTFNTISPGQWAYIVSTGSGWRGYKITSL